MSCFVVMAASLCRNSANIKIRIADERLPERSLSIICTRLAKDCCRAFAISLSAIQNGSSRDTLVRCPCIVNDRFFKMACPVNVRFIDKKLPQVPGGYCG